MALKTPAKGSSSSSARSGPPAAARDFVPGQAAVGAHLRKMVPLLVPRKMHHKARTEANAEYAGQRTTVTDQFVRWDVPWSKSGSEGGAYNPKEYTHPRVVSNSKPNGGKWADGTDLESMRGELDERLTHRYEEGNKKPGEKLLGECDGAFDETGAPRNPIGRTGLRGRGMYGRWGPNHAADPIITRYNLTTNKLQVLTIRRSDGKYALPGGLVHEGSVVSETARRSFNMEAAGFKDVNQKKTFDALAEQLFAGTLDRGKAACIFRGYVDDSRNTDNAWMETQVFQFHCSTALTRMLKNDIGSGDAPVTWINIDAEDERYVNMYGIHRVWVACTARSMRADKDLHNFAIEGVGDDVGEMMNESSYAKRDVQKAKEHALLERCVKITASESGNFMTRKGLKVEVEQFKSILFQPFGDLRDYGCSVAVTMLLRFCLAAATLFTLLQVLNVYGVITNWERNSLRHECRVQLEGEFCCAEFPNWHFCWGQNLTSKCFPKYEMMTSSELLYGGESNLWPFADRDWITDCGYVTQPGDPAIRDTRYYPNEERLDEQMPNSLMLWAGPGACYEQKNSTDNEYDTFQYTPVWDAKFCHGPESTLPNYLVDILGLWIVIAFLIWFRDVEWAAAIQFDAETRSTSDYSIHITGLSKMNPDDVEDVEGTSTEGQATLLKADLVALGIPETEIHHIEVGRNCLKEVHTLRQLAKLRARDEELKAQKDAIIRQLKRQASTIDISVIDPESSNRVSAAPTAPAPRAPSTEGVVKKAGGFTKTKLGFIESLSQKTQLQLEEVDNVVNKLIATDEMSTGHAFVVFETAKMRDEALTLIFNPPLDWDAKSGLVPPPYHGCLGFVRNQYHKFEDWVTKRKRAQGLRRFKAQYAAEPSEVFWENMEASWASERMRMLEGWVLIGVIIAIIFGVLVGFREAALQHTHAYEKYALAVLSGIFSTGMNEVLQITTTAMSYREGPDTRTNFEGTVFLRLSLVYIFNSAILPIIVGILFQNELSKTSGDKASLDQSWWDSGGQVTTLVSLLISNTILPHVNRYIGLKSLLMRTVVAPFVRTQHMLDAVYKNEPPRTGKLYAETARTFALGLAFYPFYQLSWVFTALGLFLQFHSCKFAFARIFERPVSLQEEVLRKMRIFLSFSLIIPFWIKAMLLAGDVHIGKWPFLAWIGSYGMYMLLLGYWEITREPRPRVIDENDVRFGNVTKQTGLVLDVYTCPKVTRLTVEESKLANAATQYELNCIPFPESLEGAQLSLVNLGP